MTRFSTIPRFLQRRPAPLSSRAATQWLTYSEPAPPRRSSIRPVSRCRHTNRVGCAFDSPATFAKERSTNPLSDLPSPRHPIAPAPGARTRRRTPSPPPRKLVLAKAGTRVHRLAALDEGTHLLRSLPPRKRGSGPVRPVASRASSDDPGPRATGSLLVGVTPSLQARLSLDKQQFPLSARTSEDPPRWGVPTIEIGAIPCRDTACQGVSGNLCWTRLPVDSAAARCQARFHECATLFEPLVVARLIGRPPFSRAFRIEGRHREVGGPFLRLASRSTPIPASKRQCRQSISG